MTFNIKFQTIDQYEDINTYYMYVEASNWTDLGDTIDKMLEADPIMKIISVREDESI